LTAGGVLRSTGHTLPDLALGTEWIVDAHGCDPSSLRSRAGLGRLFARIVDELGLHPAEEAVWHVFPRGGGITGSTRAMGRPLAGVCRRSATRGDTATTGASPTRAWLARTASTESSGLKLTAPGISGFAKSNATYTRSSRASRGSTRIASILSARGDAGQTAGKKNGGARRPRRPSCGRVGRQAPEIRFW